MICLAGVLRNKSLKGPILVQSPVAFTSTKKINFFTIIFEILNECSFEIANVLSKQLFTKNYLVLLHITLLLVHFNNFEVSCSQRLKVSKSYQNNEVTSIKMLLRVPNSFSLFSEIT